MIELIDTAIAFVFADLLIDDHRKKLFMLAVYPQVNRATGSGAFCSNIRAGLVLEEHSRVAVQRCTTKRRQSQAERVTPTRT